METEKKKTARPAVQQARGEEAVVWCGPSVRGVARQFTVFSRMPAALAAFLDGHPAAKALAVPVREFAGVRARLGQAGTREAMLFAQVRKETEEK